MQSITVEQLKARMDNGETLNIIDVREPHEYAEFNINGKLIPLGNIMSFQLDELEPLRDSELIIHCKAGMRSMKACMFLESAGFAHVVNVVGGLDAWKAMGR